MNKQTIMLYISNIILFSLASYSYAIPLLDNGDFSTGDLDGWRTRGVHPVVVLDAPDTSSGPRPGAEDDYFVRFSIPMDKNDTQPIGRAVLKSDTFEIPLDAESIELSFWFHFFTWDNIGNDFATAVVRESDLTDRIFLGKIGRRSDKQGRLKEFGWTEFSMSFSTAELMPGESYFLKFRLVTKNDEYPSWGYLDDVNMDATLHPVPEPMTLLLVGSGLIGVLFVKRRRKM